MKLKAKQIYEKKIPIKIGKIYIFSDCWDHLISYESYAHLIIIGKLKKIRKGEYSFLADNGYWYKYAIPLSEERMKKIEKAKEEHKKNNHIVDPFVKGFITFIANTIK